MKVIISGGGTGGHIFPAVSIADELKRRDPSVEILFVGAIGRMEMERVPAAGYKIIGLPVSGLQRKKLHKNVRVLINLIRSIFMAKKILKDFSPAIAIGVGGYASGPMLRAAARKGISVLIQEQNSYAGVTNKLLAKKAQKICVAYEGMEKYFPKDKIVLTGNPVRNLQRSKDLKKEGLSYFELKADKPVVLFVGGSLGARTINEAVFENIEKLTEEGLQVIWQTGGYYYNSIKEKTRDLDKTDVHILDFISRMDLAYNVADIIVSRAGAISISEICLMGIPSVLVPSPNVAEDHQTKNALALERAGAAIMVADVNAVKELAEKIISLSKDIQLREKLAGNCKKLAKPDATARIVDEVLKIIEN